MSEDSKIRQAGAAPCQDQQAEKRPDYDMDDCPEVLQRWPKLAPLLCDLRVTVVAAYHEEDRTSKNYHRWHQAATIVAALGGMFAVLFAIVQLPPLLPFVGLRPDLVKTFEPVAALLALLAVVLGLWAAVSKKWLVKREKAERCRFMKFGLLASPELWGDDRKGEERQALLCYRLKENLRTLDWQSLKDSVARGDKTLEYTTSRVAASIDEETIDRETLRQLFDYYQEKRLCYQREYFERQAKRRHRWNRLTRALPLLLFFASIGAALLHSLYEVRLFHSLLVKPLLDKVPPALTPEEFTVVIQTQQESYHPGPYDTATLLMLMLAASLPVIAAAIRLLRTAHEFGRNTLRFRATSDELNQLLDRLEKVADAEAKLEILHETERALQAERREWLRLMIEAEWFG